MTAASRAIEPHDSAVVANARPRKAVSLLGIALSALLVAGCSVGAAPSPSAPPTAASSSVVAATGSAPASPARTPGPVVVAVPEPLRGDWLADVDGIDGLGPHGSRIQLSFDWDGGRRFWVQPNFGDRVTLQSVPLASEPGVLRLVTRSPGTGCPDGSEGRYAWSRSVDGAFLDVTLREDACPLRAAALARTWVRSLGAINDGGRGVVNSFEPALEVTLPSRRFAMSGWDEAPDIHSFDEADPRTYLIAVRNPMGFTKPCSLTNREATAVDRTADAFVRYLRNLPDIGVTVEDVEIDGRPASRVSLSFDPASACESGELALFGPPRPSADAYWAMAPGTPVALWLVDVGSDLYLFEYGGDGVTAAQEEAVMSTVQFLDELPAA